MNFKLRQYAEILDDALLLGLLALTCGG